MPAVRRTGEKNGVEKVKSEKKKKQTVDILLPIFLVEHLSCSSLVISRPE